MSRTVTALLVVQTLTLVLLAAERLLPAAYATDGQRCEIVNWPDALTGRAGTPLRIVVDRVENDVDVKISGASQNLPISVRDWSAYGTVRVEAKN